MPFVQTPDDLWFLVRCGIGIFLAGKCDVITSDHGAEPLALSWYAPFPIV